MPSAVSSSLTRRRSEADLINGERTVRSQCLFETEARATFRIFFFFRSLFYTRTSFTPALLWTVERAPSSKKKFSRWLKVSTGRTLRSRPGFSRCERESGFAVPLRAPPSKLCHSTGIPLAEEKDERNKLKEESSDWH